MARVLLVEDDASLGRTLAERLERDRLVVQWVQSIGEASEQLRSGAWDLAIVDVRLPDGSGFGLARQIKRTTTIPVMFMTALNSAENRLEGFELGADEYLPKPFHLKEFMLRVRHVLSTQHSRRVAHAAGRTIDLDALTIDRPGADDASTIATCAASWSAVSPPGIPPPTSMRSRIQSSVNVDWIATRSENVTSAAVSVGRSASMTRFPAATR